MLFFLHINSSFIDLHLYVEDEHFIAVVLLPMSINTPNVLVLFKFLVFRCISPLSQRNVKYETVRMFFADGDNFLLLLWLLF